MKINSFYPVLISQNTSSTAAFFQVHFGFATTFESDWYVSLVLPENLSCQLAVLLAGHSTIPENMPEPTHNLILNFEVEDVDDVHNRLIVSSRLPELLTLRDEPWGQRHFITRDPIGTLIDVIKPIPPNEEYLAQYTISANPS